MSEPIEGLVKVAATRWPGALAVSDPKRVLTYGELEGHADDLAGPCALSASRAVTSSGSASSAQPSSWSGRSGS